MRLLVNVKGKDDSHRCSVYELGHSFYKALSLSDHNEYEYCEAPDLPPVGDYELVVFTHMAGRLEVSREEVAKCHKSVGIFVEAPSDPISFAARTSQKYDVIGVCDPMYESDFPKILSLPRIAPRGASPHQITDRNPVVASFGLPSHEKDIDMMIDAVSAELKDATLKLHFPYGSHMSLGYASSVHQKWKRAAEKTDLDVQIESDYLGREELINWAAEADLILFFTTSARDPMTFGSVAASPDQAIASRVPIAVNDRAEFRHILQYTKPYPERGLVEAMQDTVSVENMYEAWSPQNFCDVFEEFTDALE